MAPDLDWKDLGFSYRQTEAFVKAEYHQGRWSALEVCSEPHLSLHAAATCLHYGQSCFEGLKAFRQKNGDVCIFRPDANGQRLSMSAERIVMEAPNVELFMEACKKTVALNGKWIPPYGTGASLYLRPLLIGTTPRVGLQPAEDFLFLVLGVPVGPYYKDGFYPVKAYIQEDYDRAAPKGVGNVKVGGNYAAGLRGDLAAREKGYPIALYPDASTRTFVDEFGTSNFIGITREGTFVTPESSSVLPSITNNSLQQIARDLGLKVERRPIKIEELDSFAEVGACGTAAVITPIYAIGYQGKEFTFGEEKVAGKTLTRLYTELQQIQYGEIKDRHGWMVKVEGEG